MFETFMIVLISSIVWIVMIIGWTFWSYLGHEYVGPPLPIAVALACITSGFATGFIIASWVVFLIVVFGALFVAGFSLLLYKVVFPKIEDIIERLRNKNE